MNFYVVTFDRDPCVSYVEFHEQFTCHDQIHCWWHYIKNLYIIGTDLDAASLSDHYVAVAQLTCISTSHLVLRADLSERAGMLPEDAWQWMRDNSPPEYV